MLIPNSKLYIDDKRVIAGYVDETAMEELYLGTNKVFSYININSIGGRIFYDNGSNGATYTFYDASGKVLTDQTVSGLANAVGYTISGTPTKDRWYVVNQTKYTIPFYDDTGSFDLYSSGDLLSARWSNNAVLYGATANTIGSGKTNTALVLNSDHTGIWYYLTCVRATTIVGGYNDWFIGSKAECDALRASGVHEFDSGWSSVEASASGAYHWLGYGLDRWSASMKQDSDGSACLFRSF